MIKVCYVCNSDFGKPDTIGVRTFYAAKEANKRGVLSQVICRGNFQDEIKVEIAGSRWMSLFASGIQQYLFKNIDACSFKRKQFEKPAIRKLKPCDILHCYDYLPEVIKVAKKMGAITILDAHAGYVKEAERILKPENEKYGSKQGDSSADLEAIDEADYILCASDFSKKTFTKHGTPEKKLKTIYFGVDINHYKPVERKLTEKPTFLFVGIIEPRKGVEYLLKAFEGMDAFLLMAGRKNKIMKGHLKIPSNVTLLGHVKNIKEYYDKADVFILPSLWEASAKATYEAMACGLPVIVTPNTGTFFKDGTCGHIIPAKDISALRCSIQHLIDNPQHRISMGKEGRRVVSQYTWENYGKNVNNFYEEVLKDAKKD